MNTLPSPQKIAIVYQGNPAPLQQKVAASGPAQPGQLPPDLVDILALQMVTQQQDAAKNQLMMQQGGAKPTIADQLKQKATAAAKQEVASKLGIAGAQPMQPEQAPGIDTLPSNVGENYAGGGIIAFDKGGMPPERREGESDEDYAARVEAAQRESDAGAMANAGRKLWAAGKDVLTLPGRAVAGAAESVITRPLRALGIGLPYLPDSFYGGNRESMTPYMDKLNAAKATSSAGSQASYSNEGRNNPNPVGDASPSVQNPSVDDAVASAMQATNGDMGARSKALTALGNKYGFDAVDAAIQRTADRVAGQTQPAKTATGNQGIAGDAAVKKTLLPESLTGLEGALNTKLIERLNADPQKQADAAVEAERKLLGTDQIIKDKQARLDATKALRSQITDEYTPLRGFLEGALNRDRRETNPFMIGAAGAQGYFKAKQAYLADLIENDSVASKMADDIDKAKMDGNHQLARARTQALTDYLRQGENAATVAGNELNRREQTAERAQRDAAAAAAKGDPAAKLREQQVAAAEAAYDRDVEAQSLKTAMADITQRKNKPAMLARLAQIRAEKYAAQGLEPPPTSEAPAATGNTRIKFDSKGNQIN